MTKKLLCVLFTLIFMLSVYVFVVKFDTVVLTIESFMYNIGKEDIIVPESNDYKRDYKYTTFTMTDNFEPHSVDDIKSIFYTILNSGWDSFTFYCPNDYKECADDVKETANNQDYISLMNNYVNPYNSFINFNTMITGDKTIYISVDKLYSDNDIELLNKKIDSVLSELKISSSVNSNSIKLVHDYILDNTKYNKKYVQGDFTSMSNKANGVFVSGEAVCSGYADAFALMMDRINIPNFKVSSTDHVWNVIYYDNKWTHVDVTWDDDEVNKTNRNNFFMISADELKKLDVTEHSFDMNLYKELN